MNRLDRCFAELKQRGEKALVCFMTCGDPDQATTERLALKVFESGADVIELGVPFSDPMADGPVIQASSFRALQAGATVRKVFDTVRSIRRSSDSPIVLMTYYNPVQHYGDAEFARDAAAAGADGVIVTDLPPEEAGIWKKAAEAANLATIFLLAPTSTKDRIEAAANMASGFIYCVSRTGVTGAREDVPVDLADMVASIRAASGLPIAIGFGISKPEHVSQVAGFADGAVVGSALVSVIAQYANSGELLDRVGQFVSALKAGCRL